VSRHLTGPGPLRTAVSILTTGADHTGPEAPAQMPLSGRFVRAQWDLGHLSTAVANG
jgi:hypothetical protein